MLITGVVHVVAPLDDAVCFTLPDAQPAGVGLIWTQLVCDVQPVPVEFALDQPDVNAGHAVHDAIPELDAYVQLGHFVAVVAAAGQYVPAGHVVHVAAAFAGVGLYVPAAHGVQTA